MARKIPVRAYVQKEWGPGSTVTWTDGMGADHIGEVWSAGPGPGSVWVAEDGDPARMVAIKKPARSREAYEVSSPPDHVQALERIRATGYAIRVGYYDTLHADRDCGHALDQLADENPWRPRAEARPQGLTMGILDVVLREAVWQTQWTVCACCYGFSVAGVRGCVRTPARPPQPGRDIAPTLDTSTQETQEES